MNEAVDSKTLVADMITWELVADNAESGIIGGSGLSTAVASLASGDMLGERSIKSSVESIENPSSACGGVI